MTLSELHVIVPGTVPLVHVLELVPGDECQMGNDVHIRDYGVSEGVRMLII